MAGKPIYKEFVKEWINLYGRGYNISEIAKKYNVHRSTIARWFKKEGIKIKSAGGCKKYDFNREYFSHIDSKEKAYWFGFMMADGNVMLNKLNKGNYVRLSLQQKDAPHIKKLIKCLESNHKIVYENKNNSASLIISSEKMANDLRALGCVDGKTFKAEFPYSTLDKKYYKSFILGLFDGDGSVGSSFLKNGTTVDVRFYFLGTKHMLEGVQKFLVEELNLTKKVIEKRKGHYRLAYGGNYQVKMISDWLYTDEPIYLERKKMIFDNNPAHLTQKKVAKYTNVYKKKDGNWFYVFLHNKIKYQGYGYETELDAYNSLLEKKKNLGIYI